MPLPNPLRYKDKDTYVSACIREASKEFPQRQAIAVCISKWTNRNK
jgi:hypothetical protein